MVHEFLRQQTHCPRCQGGLSSKGGQLHCSPCQLRFPQLAEIPWLFAHPEAAWLEWRQKADYQIQLYMAEANQLQSQLSQVTGLTQKRLGLLSKAYEHNALEFKELLKPLLSGAGLKLDLHKASKSQVPLAQNFMGYSTNIHRDWLWGERENQATCQLIQQIWPKNRPMGKVLVLGAGAGRLPFDLMTSLFSEMAVELVVALDFNPLLVLLGQRMTKGSRLSLYEFPIAPTSLEETAVLGELRAPQAVGEQLIWLLADGMNPPFKPGSFDTVITPWFIDVVPQNPLSLGRKINRLLGEKGLWLNFGPYGFLQAPAARQYSREELLALIQETGHQVLSEELIATPYLQSPHSCQKREETILAFVAERQAQLPREADFQLYPEWMVNFDLPVPLGEALQHYRFATEVQSQVLAQVDGQKTLRDLAKGMASRHQISEDQAVASVVNLLRQILEGA